MQIATTSAANDDLDDGGIGVEGEELQALSPTFLRLADELAARLEKIPLAEHDAELCLIERSATTLVLCFPTEDARDMFWGLKSHSLKKLAAIRCSSYAHAQEMAKHLEHLAEGYNA